MSDRLNAYFVKEAGEYLEQMERVLRGGGSDTEKLVRLARGVRGSAQMAAAGGVAPLTERLEGAVRSIHTQLVPWSDHLRQLLLDTIDELRSLLQVVDDWSDAERERVNVLLSRWDASERAEQEAAWGAREPAAQTSLNRQESPLRPEPLPEYRAEAADEVVPISRLFYDDAGPHVISGTEEGGAAVAADQAAADGDGDRVVPIEELLLRGTAAARAALALKPRLDQLLAGGAAPRDLEPLHAELFDLLELSISEASA